MTNAQKKAQQKRIVSRAVNSALRSAEVTLTVADPKDFKNVLEVDAPAGERCTTARMDMTKHTRVSIERSKSGRPERDKLKIKPNGATIRFTIKPENQYYPIGIAFKLKSGVADPDNQQRLGLLNFETSQMLREEHILSITDSFKDNEKDDHYKFSVIIQRASDGAIGIIDPDIIHQP